MSGRTFGYQSSWDETIRSINPGMSPGTRAKAVGIADSMNQQVEEFLNRFVVTASNDDGDITFDAAGTYTFQGDVFINGTTTAKGDIKSNNYLAATSGFELDGAAGSADFAGNVTISGNILEPLRAVAGSAAAPSYTFSDDPDTGMYRSGANALSFATNATARVTIDSAGKVGIGTTEPSVPLHLNIGTNNNGILVESTDATARMSFKDSSTSGTTYVGIGAVGDDMSLWAGNAKKITVKSDGKVGIGTTSPDTNLEVVGSVRASTSFLVNSSGDDGIGPVTGSYGSVQTVGTGTGSYEGYSINGQQVFMGNGTEICGIYNDVDNQWLLKFDADTYTQLFDSDGIVAFGANNATTTGGGSGGNGYVGISNECGGLTGTTAKLSTVAVAGVTMKRLGFNTSSYEFKSGIEDFAMSDEAFMSLKPITFHPNDHYVDSTGDVTEIVGGHTLVPDKTEAGDTAGLLPLKRAGFGLEDLYGRDDTMILATEFSPDDTALIAVLTLKLQETMTRVDALEND